MLEYLFLSKVMSADLNVMEQADDVDASFPDGGPKAEKVNAVFRFSSAVSDEARGMCVIPCVYNGRDYWCVYTADKTGSQGGSSEFDLKFLTKDEVGGKDPVALLAGVKMAERKEKRTIAEAVRYEKNDELIRKAIQEGRYSSITEENFGAPLYVVYGFLNTVSPALCGDFKKLVDDGQLMVIGKSSDPGSDLVEPHAGGRGIYIPAGMMTMRIGVIVHEVFAKAGFTHEECRTFERIFDRYFSYAFDAEIVPPGKFPKRMKLSAAEMRAFAEAGYARIHTELVAGEKELIASAKDAKFLDFYGDAAIPAETVARRDYSASDERERVFERIFESSPDAVLIIDAETKDILEVNAAALEMYGYTRGEFLDLKLSDITAEKDASDDVIGRTALWDLRHIETRYHKKKDGTAFSVTISAGVIDFKGRKAVFGIMRDNTERKKAEEALRESESKFKGLFRALGEAAYFHEGTAPDGLPGRILEVNDAASRMLGYTRKELLNMRVVDIDDSSTLPHVPGMLRKLAEKGRAMWEGMHVTKDGRRVPVEIYTSRIMMGGVEFFISAVRDISRKKEAEEALKGSEEKYRTLFEKAPLAIAITSLSGRLIAANSAMCNMTGYSREDLDSIDMRTTYVDPAERDHMIMTLRETGEVRDLELKMKRKDGRVIVMLMNVDWIDLGGERMILTTGRDITERKQAEEALRAAHDLLRDVIDTTQDMIFVKDHDLRTILCNRYYAQAVGRTPEEMIGKTDIENGWPPELVLGDPSKGIRGFADDDKTALEGDTVRNVSERGEMNGKPVIFDVLKLPLKDADGNIIGVLGVARDVTMERNSQADLEHHAERLKALLELAAMRDRPVKEIMTHALGSIVLLTGSKAGSFHSYDEAANEISLTVRSGSVMPESALDHERHYPLEKAGIWADCVRSRGPVMVNDYKTEPERKGYPAGHFPVKNFLSVPVFDKGKIVMICGVGNKDIDYSQADIDDMSVLMSNVWSMIKALEAEEELKMRAREWSDTFDAMSEGVSILSPTFEILNANTALCELLGKKKEDLVGKKCYQVFHGQGASPAACPAAELMTSGKEVRAELFEPFLDKWISVSVSPIFDDQGNIVKIIHVVTDVTERRKMEEKMREEERQAAMGNLVAQIAHELNNPTGVVLGILSRIITTVAPQLVEGGEPMQKVFDLAQSGQDEMGRIARLVRELLVQARKDEREKTPQYLGGIASDAVERTQGIASRFGVTVKLEYDNDVKIRADRDRMLEVFINLINNACQAMRGCPARNLTIAVTADRGAGAAVITMTDTGKGMDEKTQERIFEGFFTTKAVGEGLGVGMQIVKRIIDEHDGKVDVSSAPGEGTAFRVTFPATEDKPGEKLYRSDAIDEKLLAGEAKRKISSVLVVDDESGMLDNWRAMLGDIGIDVVTAGNMEEALDAASKRRFDAVITDVTMNDSQFNQDSYQGYKLAVRLRSRGYQGPIAVCTGYDKDAPELVRLAQRNVVSFGISKSLVFALGGANVGKCVKALERVTVTAPDSRVLDEYEKAIASGNDNVFAVSETQGEEIDEDSRALTALWQKCRKCIHDINNKATGLGYIELIFEDSSKDAGKAALEACSQKILRDVLPGINGFQKAEPSPENAPIVIAAMIGFAGELDRTTTMLDRFFDLLSEDGEVLSRQKNVDKIKEATKNIREYAADLVSDAKMYMSMLSEIKARKASAGREEAEAVIRRSEEQFLASLDGSPMGIVLFGGDKMPFYANRAALGILGVSGVSDISEKDIQTIVNMPPSSESMLAFGMNASFVADINGEMARCSVTPFVPGQGEPSGYIMQLCYQNDEAKLRQKLAGLEEKVTEFRDRHFSTLPDTMRSLEIQVRSAGLTALVYGKDNMQADAAEQKLKASGFKGTFVRVIGELSDLETFLRSQDRPPFDFVVNATAERIEEFIKKILAGTRSKPVIDDISQKNELAETLFKICA